MITPNISYYLERMTSPFGAYNFKVEIDGIQIAGFSEVSGLNAETEVEQVKEGGLNDYVHILPKGTKYGNLILKKGITLSDELYQWYSNTVNGKIERKNGSIQLCDSSNWVVIRSWDFVRAYPVKWEGPSFNAKSSIVAAESITMVHEGLFGAKGFMQNVKDLLPF